MPETRNKVKNDVIKQIRLLLGDGMIDIELDPEHYDVALDIALSKIRQRSENAVEEDFYALELKEDVAEYTLPEEIIEVKQGPYAGDEDKTRFSPVKDDRVVIK